MNCDTVELSRDALTAGFISDDSVSSLCHYSRALYLMLTMVSLLSTCAVVLYGGEVGGSSCRSLARPVT